MPSPLPNGISVFITAYSATAYIAECLRSVYAVLVPMPVPWEVLIGVDGCAQTRAVIRRLKKGDNTRVLWFPVNRGTYVTSNTLLAERKYSHALRFDSDDIMRPGCAAYIRAAVLRENYIGRLPCYSFTRSPAGSVAFKYVKNMYLPVSSDQTKRPLLEHAHGIVIVDAQALAVVGGYRDWRCAADTDMATRAARGGVAVRSIVPSFGPAYYRRRHAASLTKAPATGRDSALRASYWASIKRDTSIYVEPVTAGFEEHK